MQCARTDRCNPPALAGEMHPHPQLQYTGNDRRNELASELYPPAGANGYNPTPQRAVNFQSGPITNGRLAPGAIVSTRQ
jgi:hypothetical protein